MTQLNPVTFSVACILAWILLSSSVLLTEFWFFPLLLNKKPTKQKKLIDSGLVSEYEKQCPEPTPADMGNEEEKIQNLNCFLKKIKMVKWLRTGLNRNFIPNSRFAEKLVLQVLQNLIHLVGLRMLFAGICSVPLEGQITELVLTWLYFQCCQNSNSKIFFLFSLPGF